MRLGWFAAVPNAAKLIGNRIIILIRATKLFYASRLMVMEEGWHLKWQYSYGYMQ